MSEFHTIETEGRTDEWGEFSVDVLLGGVVLHTLATKSPRPTNRSKVAGLHQSALMQFAYRLRTALAE